MAIKIPAFSKKANIVAEAQFIVKLNWCIIYIQQAESPLGLVYSLQCKRFSYGNAVWAIKFIYQCC